MIPTSSDDSPEMAMSRSSWPASVGADTTRQRSAPSRMTTCTCLPCWYSTCWRCIPLGDHLVDRFLVGPEAQRAARKVQELPRVFRGLKQTRDHARLELGDPRRLRLKLQDVRLNAIGPGIAESVLPCRLVDPRSP